jgi:hypothetical protein
MNEFYRANYPQIYATKRDAINVAIAEAQRIFKTNFFPEMKVNWATHPNNIGHYYFAGCFRCHDNKHVSKSGKVIRSDCNICHTTLDQTEGTTPIAIENGEFKHFVDLGNLGGRPCTLCHTGDRPFKHPIDLGNIRSFQCAECHK